MTDFGITRGKTISDASSHLMDIVFNKGQMTWLLGAIGAAALIGVLAGVSLIARLVSGV